MALKVDGQNNSYEVALAQKLQLQLTQPMSRYSNNFYQDTIANENSCSPILRGVFNKYNPLEKSEKPMFHLYSWFLF